MHTMSVRAAARRTALAAAIASTALVGIPSSSPAALAPGETRPAATATLSGPEAHPHRVVRQIEHRSAVRAKRHAELVAERRAERRAELAERRAERGERRAAQAAQSRGDQILSLAANEAGDPYVWGGAGPSSFDCSGFTQYVFAQVGVSLPHSSSAQAGVATRVTDPQPGDLVFFGGSGGVYHVAIYAGDGQIWHAPRSGDVVKLEPMWTTSGVFYGRV